MWYVSWGWVALVAGLVLGEPRLSFHPPIYLYEFGDTSDQSVHFATIGHIGAGQRFARVDLKPFPCVRRVRFVRVVVLNAHNPAHVSVRHNAVHVTYTPADTTASTYIVWASRSGARDLSCLYRLTNTMSNRRRNLVQYQSQKSTTAIHASQGHQLKPGLYPSRLWSDEEPGAQNEVSNVEGRTGEGTSTNNNAHEAKQEGSLSEDSSESNINVAAEQNNGVLNEKNDREKYEAKQDTIWKLKRQRKNNVNNKRESTTQVNNADVQDIEDPFNMTETVNFGLNTTVFRSTSPVRTVNEEIIEEYITPEQFLSDFTVPSGMSVIPGFTYQFFNLPSSSEATAAKFPPPPPGDLSKDQSEWDAYFKSLLDNNSSIATEMPGLALTASTND